MAKPSRRRAKQPSPTEEILKYATLRLKREFGKPEMGEDPYIAALLVDIDRGDGKRTECERVAAELGLQTGLAIMEPRTVEMTN